MKKDEKLEAINMLWGKKQKFLNLHKNRINLLKSNTFNSKLNRIVIIAFIIELVSLLLLNFSSIAFPLRLGMGLFTKFSNNSILMMSITLYLSQRGTSVIIGYYLNELYTKLFIKRKLNKISKAKNDNDLAKEIVLEEIEFHKKVNEEIIYQSVLQEILRNKTECDNNIFMKLTSNSNDLSEEMKNKWNTLNYLCSKRTLILSYHDLNLNKKLALNLDKFSKILRSLIYLFIAGIAKGLSISTVSIIFDFLILRTIDKGINDIFLNYAIEKRKELKNDIDAVKEKLGEFLIPEDEETLRFAYDKIENKIAKEREELIDMYYEVYKNKLTTINSSNDSDKTRSPSRTIAPIDRSLEIGQDKTTGYTRVLSKNENTPLN